MEQRSPYQALHILPAHVPLDDWYVQEVRYFLEPALWEDDRPFLGVYNPPEDLFDTFSISLTGIKWKYI